MKRYFTYEDDKSSKFWSVEVQGSTLLVVFGKIGTAGNTNTKEFADESAAMNEANKLVKEKTKKGYVEVTDESISKFSEVEFWSLVERAKSKAEDTYEQAVILTNLLASRSESDIMEFEKIFQDLYTSSYQSKLWAAAYLINGGCSDDGFDYFRGWLIAQGESIYYQAMENPDYLSRIVKAEDMGEIECEEMLSVAGNAYVQKTGLDYDKFRDLIPPKPYPEIDIDWNENDDSLKLLLPKLSKKFSDG